MRDRVHLHAESGGLGLTAAAQVAPDARLGNLLLTAHLVARALGPGFDPKEHGDAALPELRELLEAPETQSLGLEGLQDQQAKQEPDLYFRHLRWLNPRKSFANR